jgi:hypothetical protein
MKINLYNLFTKVALLSAIVVATAFVSTQAQSLAYPITASIPFDFSVADTKLPAGKYSIARAKVSSDNSVLSIFDGDGNPKDIRHSIPVSSFNAKDKSTLISTSFTRCGPLVKQPEDSFSSREQSAKSCAVWQLQEKRPGRCRSRQ